MTVGDRIRQKRLELGYTQDDVAEMLQLKSRSSINKIENSPDDKLTLKNVYKMSEVLHCSPSYLMGWEDTPKQQNNEMHLSPLEAEVIKAFRKCEYQNAVLDILHIPYKKESAVSKVG